MHKVGLPVLLPLAFAGATMGVSTSIDSPIPVVCGDTTFRAENIEEITNRFIAADSEFVQWRQENSLASVPSGTPVAMVADSMVCARVAHAVDSVMTASPTWPTYWSQKTFTRSYYEVGPYYVALIAEDTETFDSGSSFWIFDRSTMAFLKQRVLLIRL
jgi:hypothetical protein